MLSSGVFPTFPEDRKHDHIVLLIIDPQVDFHEGSGSLVGSLAVPGSNANAVNISTMIKANAARIGQIFVTLDSHHRNHIAHASFWCSEMNGPDRVRKQPVKNWKDSVELFEPTVYTKILSKDVVKGKWEPVDQSLMEHCKAYTHQLEHKGRFQLTIWPEHCLIGSPGHCVQHDIYKALQCWTRHSHTTSGKRNIINYIYKGSNNLTEMYSAICAEVPVVADVSTHKNYDLLDYLTGATKVVVCGQALSHCVNYTVSDIVEDWSTRTGKNLADMVILTDCMSSVSGYEKDGEKFLADMTQRGLTLTTHNDPTIFTLNHATARTAPAHNLAAHQGGL